MAEYDPRAEIRKKEFVCKPTLEGEQVFDQIHRALADKPYPYKNESVNEVAEGYDMSFLGAGTSRAAYRVQDERLMEIVENCVVKTALTTTILDNKMEVFNWYLISNFASEKTQQMFAPILAFDEVAFSWVVMPMVDSGIGFNKAQKVSEMMETTNYYAADYGMGNMGEVNDRPVIIDYGVHFARLIMELGTNTSRLYFTDTESTMDFSKKRYTAKQEFLDFKRRVDRLPTERIEGGGL